MASLYPIFINRLCSFFIGKDARSREELIEEVYMYRSNHKLQSLALWVPLATIEFAVLDMPGKTACGEQESGLHAFRWLTGNDAMQVVQPGIFYFGGKADQPGISI